MRREYDFSRARRNPHAKSAVGSPPRSAAASVTGRHEIWPGIARRKPVRRIVPGQRGGWRPGAGRKPKGKSGVSHRQRAALVPGLPVYATIGVQRRLPSLRGRRELEVLRSTLAAGSAGVRGRFRILHCAVMAHRLHFVVEARNRKSLRSGLQGLLVRIARALNRLWGRAGKVFADRYLDRVIERARDVQSAIRYVLEQGGRFVVSRRELDELRAAD
jgi:REP element-mobilizing transposase RayT